MSDPTRAALQPTDDGRVQFLRYLVVGGLAFVLDFGTLALTNKVFGVHYLIATAIAFTVGLAFNYTLSTLWVFSHRTMKSAWAEFAVFAAIGLAGLGMSELMMWALVSGLGVAVLVAKVFVTGVVFIWNFGVRKLLLFRGEQAEGNVASGA